MGNTCDLWKRLSESRNKVNCKLTSISVFASVGPIFKVTLTLLQSIKFWLRIWV